MPKMMIYRDCIIPQANILKHLNKTKNLNQNLKICHSQSNILKIKMVLNQYAGFVKRILIIMENKEIPNQHA
jgi:hypothetical protein